MLHPNPQSSMPVIETPTESGYSSFQLAADRGAVKEIRRRILDFARTLPFNKEELNSIEIAVGEAAANAVRHGSPLGEIDQLRVQCEYHDGLFTVQINDQGSGFLPSNVPMPVAENLKTSGYGLCLMNGLMDEVSYSFSPEGGTLVRLSKRASLQS